MPEKLPPPDECANCGAAIPRDARACPECGADERTGWRETSVYDGLDLPGYTFENDPSSPRYAKAVRRLWVTIGTILLLAFIYVFVLRG